MHNSYLLSDGYTEHLKTINHVSFTRREIDIIAFLVSGRGVKYIASFFSISPKTVETHTHNIMVKLECNSRESIISFIEKSNKFSAIKKYYLSKLVESSFEQRLKEISPLLKGGRERSYLIMSWKAQGDQIALIHQLENHLRLLGIKISTKIPKKQHSVPQLIHKSEKVDYVIYVAPGSVQQKSQTDASKENLKSLSTTEANIQSPKTILFLLLGNENSSEVFKSLINSDAIKVMEQKNYYFLFFEILKRILPGPNLQKILEKFTEDYEVLHDSNESNAPVSSVKMEIIKRKKSLLQKIMCDIKGKQFYMLIIVCTILIGGGTFLKWNSRERLDKYSIRSDLNVPSESSLLDRPELIAQIDKAFHSQNTSIQTVALVGMGGAGKTTLARNYASTHPATLIWELNGETSRTLLDSLERMAERLARTEEEKKILNRLQEIKDSQKREEKLLMFAQEKLKAISNWILIYDNVDELANVQNYFPQDKEVWGTGKVILTTKNSNIANNKRVSGIIQVGELSSPQKFLLFSKIMNHGSVHSLKRSEDTKTKEFLQKLPPFPLDISVAAYYLKASNVSYATYLDNMDNHRKNFVSMQEDILREAGDYTKTRYGIITMSLENIINTHKDYGDLLLFVSLLDSHNIPRDLLDLYKSNLVVDSFIHCLKKHSLITNEALIRSSSTTFSLHSSTLEISLTYLMNSLPLEKRHTILQSICNTTEIYSAAAINKEDFAKMKLLISHYQSLLRHANLFTSSIRNSLESTLGELYYYLCFFKRSETILKKNLTNLEESYNKDYLKIARLSFLLGNTYICIGYYREPQILLERSLSLYRKYSPQSHIEIAKVLAHLGDIYRSLGEYPKAIISLEQSMDIFKKDLPENQANVGRVLSYLGNVNREFGNYTKSMSLLKQGLDIYKKQSQGNDIGFVWVTICLGMLHSDLGEYQKAKNLLEKSIITIERNSLEDYANLGWAISCLGNVYTALGDYEKAESLLKKGLSIYETHIPNDYINIAWVSGYLGKLYIRLNNYDEAEQFLKKSVKVFEKYYGKNHVEPARILRTLGENYLAKGQLENAESIFMDVLRAFEQSNHPEVFKCQEDLAELCMKKSIDSEEKKDRDQAKALRKQAINYLRQALRTLKLHFPIDSSHIKRIDSKLRSLEGEE